MTWIGGAEGPGASARAVVVASTSEPAASEHRARMRNADRLKALVFYGSSRWVSRVTRCRCLSELHFAPHRPANALLLAVGPRDHPDGAPSCKKIALLAERW